jgi:hypothetical protein
MNREAVLAAVAALPSLAWTAAVAVSIALSAAGVSLLDPDPPLSLTEAAALQDQAEVHRLVRRGHDPNASYVVRRDLLRSRPYVMTPLEGAVAERRVDMVRLLVDLGARIDDHTFPSLWCFAQGRHDGDVIALIEAHRPSATPVPSDCTRVNTPW